VRQPGDGPPWPFRAIGFQHSWWLITWVLFFLPYAYPADWGTTYPSRVAVHRVKKAFGEKWAARTTLALLDQRCFWMPSVYVLLPECSLSFCP
jgi:hypothetical protein